MSTERLATWIDSQRFQCRLRELAFFGPADAPGRIERIVEMLSQLKPGRYLLGLGPNFSEIVSLRQYPVRLGRHAGPGEASAHEVIDFTVTDAGIGGPREVSRVHCTVTPQPDNPELAWLSDEGSTTGTWLHPQMDRLKPSTPVVLQHGMVFSLGPSGTNLVAMICIQ